MIDVYTEKVDSENWIIKNDLFFNLYTSNEEMSQREIDIIRKIDNAVLRADNRIETIYGVGILRNLSTGCKTLLNIIKHPDKVVCIEECGPNVLEVVFRMNGIKIYMSRPSFIEITADTEIRFNNSDTVIGANGYNRWWNAEYKRRNEDDL